MSRPRVLPRRRSLAAAVGAIALAATSLAACSSSDAGSGSSGSTSGGDALVLAIQQAPTSFDPSQVEPAAAGILWNSVYESLAYRDPVDGVVKPWAATGWKYSKDGLHLTVTLRDGLKFSDGNPVKASDVAATMNRNIETPGYIQTQITALKSVDAPDDKTVVLNFKYFDPKFLPLLGRELGTFTEASALKNPNIATDPLGSGPYTLDKAKTVPGSSYVLSRRDDYWDVASFPFKTVTVRLMNDPTASLNAFKAGEVNAVAITPEQEAAAKATSGAVITPTAATAIRTMLIIDKGGKIIPQFKDVRVRQALNYAIDRKGIADKLLLGFAKPTEQVFSTGGTVHDDALDDTYPYDPAKAKALLAEAGYPDGFSVQIPSTNVSTKLEPTLSQQLGAVGIKVQWVAIPDSQATTVLSSGKFPLSLKDSAFASDAYTAINFLGAGTNNPEKFTTPELTKLMDTLNSTVDPEAAKPTLAKINEYSVKEALEVPLYNPINLWATSQGVQFVDKAGTTSSVRQFGVAAK
ncbi:peptide/nickel transport system substrate-binding protein [Microlunatus flavus]|uniref:Peptide/nickel transport system substrate-binding protein n=1 Tax=Microlunatus flavus TaxID=1036181 RepID=A0A1H9A809_9ACTN|nr:peptide/nickel transport system substrate-binding protein [Microlunatus flavus]